MTQSAEQERAEFEAWLAPEYSREKWHTGEYTDDTVFSMFAAWQAARRAPAVPVPQGWKLVPVEPTQEMVDSGSGCWMMTDDNAAGYWAAMIAAAPQPPEAAPVRELLAAHGIK